jgi:hypothetical protein
LDAGIWAWRDELLVPVAQSGSIAPQTGGMRFTRFDSIAMPSDGVVFFTARVRPYLGLPHVGAEYGLWVWNGDRASLILRKSGQVSVNGQNLTVKSFRALSAMRGSAGQGRYDSSETSVDVLIGFTDGTSAIASATSSGDLVITSTSNEPDRFPKQVAGFGMPCSFGEEKAKSDS